MKTCLIVVNTHKNPSLELSGVISAFLKSRGVAPEVFLFPQNPGLLPSLGPEASANPLDPFAGKDLVITLGGDGTVLFAARRCAPLGIPVFPVNLGEFGFIAHVQRRDWERQLGDFLDGKIAAEGRTMAEVTVEGLEKTQKKTFTSNALNDIMLVAENPTKLITLDISCHGTSFGRFKADAIIVATPTGSTAYSASAGGPIIDPALDALVLTPVCPFSLSSRPLVLTPESELEITLPNPNAPAVQVLADGQFVGNAAFGESRIRVKKSKYAVKLAGSDSATFYAALRSKMNWSGGPVA
jgi:NAD+ kinase